MRSLSPILLVLFGFFAINHAHAQTWTQPVQLGYTSWQVVSGNTCSASDTIDIYDNWFDSPGPDIVYELRNRQPVGSPHYSSAVITLFPSNNSYPAVDFELFACQLKYGNTVQNCPLEADNVNDPTQPVQIVIPTQDVSFRIILTAANLYYFSRNPCAPYTLFVQRLP